MATSYTSLLGLALPVTGELSGTWGDTVNNAITSLLDSAVAGTTTITADADITLSDTDGASNESRQAIIIWATTSGTTTRNITAPAQSKAYIVINKAVGAQSIVVRGAGPTTGVTIVQNEYALVAWNGSDFVKIATNTVDGVSTISFGSTGFTPSTATSGVVTVAGTLANTNGGTGQSSAFTQYGITYASTTTALATTSAGTSTTVLHGNASGAPTFGAVSLTADVSGTLPVGNGGTGAATLAGASIATYTGTETLTNKTLTNPTVTNYVESVVAIGNSGTSKTIDLTNGTVQTVTMTGNCTFTMPTATAGKSFILICTQDGTGSRTAVFTSVKFPNGTAPTLTTTATTGVDILTFVANGTSWFGTAAQNFS